MEILAAASAPEKKKIDPADRLKLLIESYVCLAFKKVVKGIDWLRARTRTKRTAHTTRTYSYLTVAAGLKLAGDRIRPDTYLW